MDGEYYMGQIITTGFGFVPKDFALCNGQLLPINIYQALFSLLGTRYGGDGIKTFGVPDLRGRTPVGAGASDDSSWQPAAYAVGTREGAETVALTSTQLPEHTHDINVAKAEKGDLRAPVNNVLGVSQGSKVYGSASSARVTLAANAVASRGAGAGHENMQPFQVLSFCIALRGIYPSRS